jgi:hypothetical protein
MANTSGVGIARRVPGRAGLLGFRAKLVHDATPSSSSASATAARRVRRCLLLALLASPAALLIPPRAGGASAPPSSPTHHEPSPDGWTRREVELVARTADVGHLGIHTHANWVVFDLPFDPSDTGIRRAQFAPRTTERSDVGALRVGPICLRAPPVGDVADARWTKLTQMGGAGTRPFWEWDGIVPEAGPRAFVVSVPSRVANAAACWLPALARRETWRLGVTWETAPPR